MYEIVQMLHCFSAIGCTVWKVAFYTYAAGKLVGATAGQRQTYEICLAGSIPVGSTGYLFLLDFMLTGLQKRTIILLIS